MLDKEFDLYYGRARYLNSRLGRWNSPDHRKQYVDGSNMFEAYCSNPVNGYDPTGTERLQYKYTAIWFLMPTPEGASDTVKEKIGAWNDDNKKMALLLDTRVKEILRSYGIDSSRVGKGMQPDQLYLWPDRLTEMQPRNMIRHNYSNIDSQTKEGEEALRYLSQRAKESYGPADDVIAIIQGMTAGTAGLGWGFHDPNRHVIALSYLFLNDKNSEVQAITICHEILHHFLGETINPTAPTPEARSHDTQGIMDPTGGGPAGMTTEIGSKTVEALKHLKVTKDEITARQLKSN